eukprot:m.121754 g.121754  ORF g.121754 m.121754 type:complete len:421 (+) comp9380_c2_seq1:76-1338(+)
MRVHPSLLETFTDSATLGMFVMAVSVVFYSCNRAVFNPIVSHAKRDDTPSHHHHHGLSWRSAPLLPILASVALLLLYYLNQYFEIMVSVVLAFTCAVCLFSTLYPHIRRMEKWLFRTQHPTSTFLTPVASFFFTSFVTARWLVTSSWIYVDLLALGLVIFLVSAVRIPSGRSGSFLLLLFLLYDVFWVLLSPLFFDSDVMDNVADQKISNPVVGLAKIISIHLNLPLVSPPMRFEIPSFELANAMAYLGLGDVVIPAMFGAYCLAFDCAIASYPSFLSSSLPFSSSLPLPSSLSVPTAILPSSESSLSSTSNPSVPPSAFPRSSIVQTFGANLIMRPFYIILHHLKHATSSYFGRVLLGYSASLWISILACKFFLVTQPALLYVVPGTLIPPLLLARSRGHFSLFWSGSIFHPPPKVVEN